MENAVDALKIAFAVMIFAMALTLSISSFSNASSAIDAIIEMRDRETEYTYVEPSKSLTREVGIETVASTMYRAIEQNLEIYFFDTDGVTPLAIYYAVDSNNNKILEAGENVTISSINFSNSENGKFTDKEDAKAFLDVLLGGTRVSTNISTKQREDYLARMIEEYKDTGIYDEFKSSTFEEKLGEYYEGTGATQTKKRVITYILQSNL